MDSDRTEKNVVVETTLQLKLALKSGDVKLGDLESDGTLRRVVTNAQNAMVKFDSVRASLTGELMKIGLEQHADLPDESKLRFRAEVLLNAYQDWGAEIAAKEAALSR
jgi:hypothetical protein